MHAHVHTYIHILFRIFVFWVLKFAVWYFSPVLKNSQPLCFYILFIVSSQSASVYSAPTHLPYFFSDSDKLCVWLHNVLFVSYLCVCVCSAVSWLENTKESFNSPHYPILENSAFSWKHELGLFNIYIKHCSLVLQMIHSGVNNVFYLLPQSSFK